MKKNLIFFLLFVLHLISKENKRDISESLNTLTTRLLQLNEKYASIEEGLDKILKKPTVSPILSQQKKVLFDKSRITADPELKKNLSNEINLYLGFIHPQSSNFRNYVSEFEFGSQFELEYLRYFGSLALGGSIGRKAYSNKKISGIPIIGEIKSSGENQVISTTLSSGWKKRIGNLLFLKTKVSSGIAFINNSLNIYSNSYSQKDTSFYYSISTGIGFAKSEFAHAMFYYKFDGHQSVERFGNQTFNQLGVSFGINY